MKLTDYVEKETKEYLNFFNLKFNVDNQEKALAAISNRLSKAITGIKKDNTCTCPYCGNIQALEEDLQICEFCKEEFFMEVI